MSKQTIKEIKEFIQSKKNLTEEELNNLKKDPRIGVQKLIHQYHSQQEKLNKLILEHQQRQHYEHELYSRGFEFIAGLDEVGRGPLAGPVVCASVILPKNMDAFIGINESKSLSHQQRKQFSQIIKENALAYSVIEIDNKLIDKVNILEATKLGMIKSIKKLPIKPQHLLIDALNINCEIPQTAIVKGDQLSISIAAASILAKVHRDELMIQYHEEYPEFDFINNMGYGTKAHLEGLKKFGYTPIHRHSFSPVQNANFPY
ncbi:ribonuclease HII [Aerococcaceae bacterium WGS1372]